MSRSYAQRCLRHPPLHQPLLSPHRPSIDMLDIGGILGGVRRQVASIAMRET